jgi:hypothetical protein
MFKYQKLTTKIAKSDVTKELQAKGHTSCAIRAGDKILAASKTKIYDIETEDVKTGKDIKKLVPNGNGYIIVHSDNTCAELTKIAKKSTICDVGVYNHQVVAITQKVINLFPSNKL